MNTKTKLSHLRRPADLTPEAWQRRLRRQFGREQKFKVENVGDEPVFSEFRVTNPKSGGTYRVAIRGTQPGVNFCACPDFATNDLGTCKHIESVLARLERRPGGVRALRRAVPSHYSEIYLRYGGERQVRFRAGLSCPHALARRAKALFSAGSGDVLPSSKYLQLDEFLDRTCKSSHQVRCYDDVLDFIAQARDAEHRRSVLDEAYPAGPKAPALQGLLNATLYPYQARARCSPPGPGAACIGDEMGLGKTIQAHRRRRDHGPALRRRAGADRLSDLAQAPVAARDRALLATGRRRSSTARGCAGCGASPSDGFFKITNYDTFTRDLDLIDAWSPDLVILDEAQRIKNWNTRAARSVKRIASPYAIVLTGTPLENRLEELISIVQFVDRYRLGPTSGACCTSTRCATRPARWSATATSTASARRWRRSCSAGTRTRCSTSCPSASTRPSSCR